MFSGDALDQYKGFVAHGDPLLRCWKVLVPLKMVVDLESACPALERLARRPEAIVQRPWQNVAPDQAIPVGGDHGRWQRPVQFQFRPP